MTDEIAGTPRVPKEELEELVDKWRTQAEHKYRVGGMLAADELEALIERHDYE